jgi:membrane associated rhomboid family serine protease
VANRFQFALPDPRRRDGWTRAGNIDLTTTTLLVIAGVASMFVWAISKSAVERLMFHPVCVRDGDIWRIATWPLANPPTEFWVIITLAFFWFIGHAVEGMVGRNRYLGLIVAVTIIPAVFVTLLPPASFPTSPEVGLSLLASVMFVIFAVQYPQQPFFFGIPAWVLALVFVGIDVLRYTGDRWWGTLLLLLSSIAVGVIMVRQWGFAERLHFIPQIAGQSSSSRRRRKPARKSRSKSRSTSENKVVDGPWGQAARPMSRPEAAAAQHELDILLDKISASGLESLSAAEKQRLNELSKRLR